MKITVINGTEKRGVTYRLKENFLECFIARRSGVAKHRKGRAYVDDRDVQITEYYLPKDCPAFCCGCARCCTAGEGACKDSDHVQRIADSLSESDLIVIASPAYVMHATGAVKALLDHLAYRWMPHRPAAEMFGKRAVIITQCLGAGAKTAAKDIKHSLSWWGISKIGVFTGALMGGIVWDDLPEKRRKKIIGKVRRLAARFSRYDYSRPTRTKLSVKIKFAFCRLIQKKLYGENPEFTDAEYWHDMGWLGKTRPWKRGK